MKFRKVEDGYLIRLDKGEEIIGMLTAFTRDQNIRAGVFSGIGGIIDASIGNYNTALRQYITKNYKNMLEVGHLYGNVSVKENSDERSIHCHIMASSTTDGQVIGHLFGAFVEVTIEIYMKVFDTNLTRKFDQESDYHIWDL